MKEGIFEEKNFLLTALWCLKKIFLSGEPTSGLEGAPALGGYSRPKVVQLYGPLEMLLWTLKKVTTGAQLAYWGHSKIFRTVSISAVVKRAAIIRIFVGTKAQNPKKFTLSDDFDPTHGSMAP